MGFLVPSSGGSAGPANPIYTRNPEWIYLPDVHATDSEISGLFGVFEGDVNLLAFNISVVGGYTVDWGDGNIENFASGVQANHNYIFTDVNVATLTTEGYRQAIVKVTAQTPGTHFTSVLFNLRHPNKTINYVTNWLDIKLRTTSDCTTFDFMKASNVVIHTSCACFQWFGAYGGTSLASTFAVQGAGTGAYSLEKVVIPDITNGTCSFQSMFNALPAYDITFGTVTSGVKNVNNMFSNMKELVVAPFFNTSGITTVTSMFENCFSLREVPLYDFSSCTTFTSIFRACSSLEEVPLFNLSSTQSMSNTFDGCVNLKSIPAFNLSNCITLASTFSGCSSLTDVGLMTLKTGTANGQATSTFLNCIGLIELPLLDFSKFTIMTSTFSGCLSLQKIPLFNFTACTDATSLFSSCTSLRYMPALSFASGCVMTTIFNGAGIEVMDTINFTSLATTSYTLAAKRLKGILLFRSILTLTGINQFYLENDIINPAVAYAGGSMGNLNITSSQAAIDSPVTVRSCTTAANSTTITCTNTTGISVGMYIYGTGTSCTTVRTVTSTSSTLDNFTLAGHGLTDGLMISFINTPGGVTSSRIYYVINSTPTTFQISTIIGGSAVNLTTEPAATFKVPSTVVSINPNVDITTDYPQSTSATNNLSFRTMNACLVYLKGATLTG